MKEDKISLSSSDNVFWHFVRALLRGRVVLDSTDLVKVNNTSLRGSLGSLRGNLLQDAVGEGKRNFVRILLEFG